MVCDVFYPHKILLWLPPRHLIARDSRKRQTSPVFLATVEVALQSHENSSVGDDA